MTPLEHALETMAYHIAEAYNAPKRFRGGICHGAVQAFVDVEIRPVDGAGVNVWDQCSVNGAPVGNRCAMRNAIVRAYAPVIAAAAADQARVAA